MTICALLPTRRLPPSMETSVVAPAGCAPAVGDEVRGRNSFGRLGCARAARAAEGAFGSSAVPLAFRSTRRFGRRPASALACGGVRLSGTCGRGGPERSRQVAGDAALAQTGVSSVASIRIMRWIIAGRRTGGPTGASSSSIPGSASGRFLELRRARSRSASSQEGQTSEPTRHGRTLRQRRPAVCGEE